MPAVAIVAEVVISDVVAEAGIGAAIAGAVGGGVIGSIASGAVIGAVSGAVGAEITGGNVWKGVEMGSLGGGVAGGVTAELGGTAEVTDAAGKVTTPGTTGLLTNTQGLVQGNTGLNALSRALGSTAGGLVASGGNVTAALESGGITGLASYLFPTYLGQDKGEAATAQAEQGALSTGLKMLLAGSPKIGAATGGGFSGTTSTPQATPGSSALAQVLNTGGAGGPVFGSVSGEEKSKKAPWNVESLRYMGSEQESESG